MAVRSPKKSTRQPRHHVPAHSRQWQATLLLGLPLSFSSPAAFLCITQAAEGCHFNVSAFLWYFKWTELNI